MEFNEPRVEFNEPRVAAEPRKYIPSSVKIININNPRGKEYAPKHKIEIKLKNVDDKKDVEDMIRREYDIPRYIDIDIKGWEEGDLSVDLMVGDEFRSILENPLYYQEEEQNRFLDIIHWKEERDKRGPHLDDANIQLKNVDDKSEGVAGRRGTTRLKKQTKKKKAKKKKAKKKKATKKKAMKKKAMKALN